MRKKKKNILLEDILITTIGSKGVGIGKTEQGKTVIVNQAIPGDIVDVWVTKSKSNYFEGKIQTLKQESDLRIKPECNHFYECGGCSFQHLPYNQQLKYKEKEVNNNIQKISGIKEFNFLPILGCEETFFYRNKMQYGFSNNRWLKQEEIENIDLILDKNALGFHIPGMWSKILQINKCFLQEDPSNEIRNKVYDFCIKNDYEFFDLRNQTGFIRQLMIRSNQQNEFMVLFQITYQDNKIYELLEYLKDNFPQIKSLGYAINDKPNDMWYDLDVKIHHGNDHIIESMEHLKFKIYPKSFYQTNPKQALNLYRVARDFAQLTKEDLVFDLYTGTGTIAQFVAPFCKKVIGIESVEDAIKSAKETSKENNITNCEFICGDMKDTFSEEIIQKYGKPDVIITDPPRDGMHKKVVEFIIKLQPKRIVYVSCNSATQARDLEILKENYELVKVQAVDMFPQTYHVESVVLLELKP